MNNSTQKVIIEYESRHGDSEAIFNYGWDQEIEEIPLSVFDGLFNEKRSILLPSKKWDILYYYPNVELSKRKEAYEKVSALPLSLKLNAIYTILVISTEDGRNILTLDTFDEKMVKKKILSGKTSLRFLLCYNQVQEKAQDILTNSKFP